MPDDQCRRLPDPRRSRRPGERARADAVATRSAPTCTCGTTRSRPGRKHFRLVRYDRRGHGKSGVPKGPYSMEHARPRRARRARRARIEKTNWCGLSMGGMVGQWLGANAPRPRREAHPLQHPLLLRRQAALGRPHQVRAGQWARASSSARSMERWFTKDFREREPEAIGKDDRDVRRDQARRLSSAAARRCATWTTARSSPNQGADPGDRRPQGSGDAAGVRPGVHPQDDPGRKARRARCRAYRQHRAAQGLHRRGARISSRSK